MWRRCDTGISQAACANDDVSPSQGVLLAVLDVDLDGASAIVSFLDKVVWQLVPNLDRATENERGVKSATGGDVVDGLGADDVCSGHKLGLSGRILFVASI